VESLKKELAEAIAKNPAVDELGRPSARVSYLRGLIDMHESDIAEMRRKISWQT